MDQITSRNQPVSHLAALTCGSCIRAGQRAAAGTTRAGPYGRRLLATAVASDPGNGATLGVRRAASSALAPVTLHGGDRCAAGRGPALGPGRACRRTAAGWV